MADTFAQQEGNEPVWRQILIDGHPLLVKKQRRYHLLPHDPRCTLCLAPFEGVGGWLVRRTGVTRSKRNPRFCNKCDMFMHAYPGGAETPLSIMFVDIRNSVAMSAGLPARDYARLVSSLRDAVAAAMTRTNGSIIEFQGDCVVAIWPPGIAGADHARKAIDAAKSLVEHIPKVAPTGFEIPIGIGVHSGVAYVCTIMSVGNDLQEVGAFGLDINLAARLCASAPPGKALISEAACAAAGVAMDPARTQAFSLKGIEAAVSALSVG